MTPTVVTLNGVASSTITELLIVRVRRQLVGARRDQFVEVPGRPGSWVFPEEPGDGRIVIEFDLLGDDFAARRAAVRALAAWADTLSGPQPMVIDDEADRYRAVVLISEVDVDEWLLRGAGALEYRCSPYAFESDPSLEEITATPSGDSGTFLADDEVIAYPVIEITPTNGTVTEFTLDINGDSLTWAGLIADDDTITISSISATITSGPSTDVNLTGAYEAAALAMTNVTGTFPLLVPGLNAWGISWAGTATTVDVNIYWRRRFR